MAHDPSHYWPTLRLPTPGIWPIKTLVARQWPTIDITQTIIFRIHGTKDIGVHEGQITVNLDCIPVWLSHFLALTELNIIQQLHAILLKIWEWGAWEHANMAMKTSYVTCITCCTCNCDIYYMYLFYLDRLPFV